MQSNPKVKDFHMPVFQAGNRLNYIFLYREVPNRKFSRM